MGFEANGPGVIVMIGATNVLAAPAPYRVWTLYLDI